MIDLGEKVRKAKEKKNHTKLSAHAEYSEVSSETGTRQS